MYKTVAFFALFYHKFLMFFFFCCFFWKQFKDSRRIVYIHLLHYYASYELDPPQTLWYPHMNRIHGFQGSHSQLHLHLVILLCNQCEAGPGRGNPTISQNSAILIPCTLAIKLPPLLSKNIKGTCWLGKLEKTKCSKPSWCFWWSGQYRTESTSSLAITIGKVAHSFHL